MRSTARLLLGIALLVGCDNAAVPTATQAAGLQRAASAPQSFTAAVNNDLARLRQATAAFHRFDVASHAGWSEPITACMTDPGGAGGMGFHYGKVKLIDGSVSVEEPELLLYEPEKNGELRLVAVEYIIPYTFHSRDAEPPVLFGQKFAQVDAFQLWGLHAWVWNENPSGMFAPWNPRVTCDNTANASAMSHN
jgi:hypothetical protein